MSAPYDRRLTSTPFSHAGYMFKLWDQLVWGSTLVVPPTPWSAQGMFDVLRDEQITEIEGSYARLLDDFRRPRTIYSEVRDIINQRQTAHQLSAYLDDPLWDDLEDLLGEVVGRCKPVYFYLDALDEEFSHAPMYWLKCQEGLFYQVMRLLRDPRLGGRLHIVVCIRDIVMSSVYRSEHAPRYYNEPHIRVLTWDRGSLLYLCLLYTSDAADE